MSTRYEWVGPDAEVSVVGPEDRQFWRDAEDEPASGKYALVVGDPYATALVVEGGREELLGFAGRLVRAVHRDARPEEDNDAEVAASAAEHELWLSETGE